MGYRGDDLDLRTPQTWSATTADLGVEAAGNQGVMRGGRSGPIWVDDTVLACSNHAFDVALAHRAGEVRLEHLIHALTRIDAAADALEARAVRVANLRRDSATIIASDIPVGLQNGKGVPRRSEEFAEVLRLAAVNASRRNAPAGIEDLLYVMMDQRADLPGLSLLQRNIQRAPVREAGEPLPPLTRYVPEPPRYVPAPQMERVVERYVRSEPQPAPRYVQEPVRTYRPEVAPSPVDTVQNARLESLEQLVRTLSNDLGNERQVVSGLIKDLSRDQGRLHSGLTDRLQGIEQVVAQPRGGMPVEGLVEHLQAMDGGLDQRFNDLSRSWVVLSDRLQGLELAVRDASSGPDVTGEIVERLKGSLDLKPIAHRLDIIEEALLSREPASDNGVADRLKTLEGEIARALASNTASTSRMESLLQGFERQKSDFGNQISGPLMERFSTLLSSQANQPNLNSGIAEAISKMADRVDAAERAVAAEIETAAAKHQAYAKDLGEVHDALMKLNQNQHTLAGSIDQWRSDAAGDLSVISNRLSSFNSDNSKPMETLTALNGQMDTLNKMMIERYHRRNRFWYWLFGTDDWIGTSWPSQTAAIEAEKLRLKMPGRKI